MGKFAVKWIWALGKKKPALCYGGSEHMLCVVTDHPTRVIVRPARDFHRADTVQRDGKEYNVEDAVKKFQEIAVNNGITAGASRLLDRCLQQAAVIDEDSFTDEEELTMEGEPVIKDQQGAVETASTDQTKEKTTVSSKKKTAKAKAPAKAPAKTKSAAKKDKGPSRISKAVEYMSEQVKKAGGQSKLERGFRKDLFAKAAEKFELSPITCSIQYNRQVLNKGKKD